MEMKLKGKGEVSWSGVNVIFAGVQEMERARGGVAVLLNDMWYSAVIDFGCVRSRILRIKFKFSNDKICVLVRYDPNEGNGEERESFWNVLDRTVDRIGNGYRLWVLGDLNGWIGDRGRAKITGSFVVPGENDNGRGVVEFCAKRGLCVGNTYFEHESLHKYTRVARDQDGGEVKSMLDLVLVKKDMLRFCQDVRTVKGMERGISDHLVLCKIRLVVT